MKNMKTDRGFQYISEEVYASNPPAVSRLLQQSSAIDCEYEHGLNNPGSSYLWIGEDHHLSREEVRKFVAVLNHWLDTGRLFDDSQG
jgi:hypothetical protein